MGIKEEMEKFENNVGTITMSLNQNSGDANIELRNLSTPDIAFLIDMLFTDITNNEIEYKALVMAMVTTHDMLKEE